MTGSQSPTPAPAAPSTDVTRLAADAADRGRRQFDDLDALAAHLDSTRRTPVERVIGVHQ